MTSAATVDLLLRHHGVHAPWHPLPALGVANTIYATEEVVLRIATDHEQAVTDARTESVAAPAARAAGVRTPRLIAFDDSRALIDRPYSIWERVHGETVGTLALDDEHRLQLWHAVGRELARLHTGVAECHDPNGWLDEPSRERDPERLVHRLREEGQLDARAAADLLSLVRDLQFCLDVTVPPRFLHDDLHAWNLMCAANGDLLAIIDWGDAGWGDPTIDFGYMPADAVAAARAGYESLAPALLGHDAGARIAWDQLYHGLERMMQYDAPAPQVAALRALAEHA